MSLPFYPFIIFILYCTLSTKPLFMDYIKDIIKLKPSTWVVALTFLSAIVSVFFSVFLIDKDLFIQLDLIKLFLISVGIAVPIIFFSLFGFFIGLVFTKRHLLFADNFIPLFVFLGSLMAILFIGSFNLQLFLKQPPVKDLLRHFILGVSILHGVIVLHMILKKAFRVFLKKEKETYSAKPA